MNEIDLLEAARDAAEAEFRADDYTSAELVALLRSESLDEAIYAARWLAERKATEAIEPMIALIEESRAPVKSRESVRHSSRVIGVAEAFAQFGPLAISPLVLAHDRSPNWEARDNYALALSLLGVHDPMIARVLEQALDRDPPSGALLIAQYGDKSLLSAIERAIASYDPDFRDFTDCCEFGDLMDAYGELGGELPSDLEARLRGWEDIWARNFGVETKDGDVILRGPGKPRAKQRCSCNSGKRYHKCCMPRPRPVA
jgi:hypothetical protein